MEKANQNQKEAGVNGAAAYTNAGKDPGVSFQPPPFQLKASEKPSDELDGEEQEPFIPLQLKLPVVQRAENDLLQSPVTLDGGTFRTYEEITAWYMWRKLRLLELRGQLERESLGIPAEVIQCITAVESLIDINHGGGTEPVTEGIANDARRWFTTFTTSITTGERAIGAEAAARLAGGRAELEAARERLNNEILPGLRDRQHEAFMADNESQLMGIADAVATALDTSLALNPLTQEVQQEIATLRAWGYRSGANIASRAGQVFSFLERVNRVYAGFQLIRDTYAAARGGRTDAESGRAGVNAMSTAVSAGGTLLGASSAFSLYANLYLGPLTQACLRGLARLEGILRLTDRDAIQLGNFDLVHWGVQPGGRPMFNFILQVMRASSASEVPSPIPTRVAEYLMSQRSGFNAGLGTGRRGMPTTGLVFHDLNQADAPYWVFNNRQNIWAMLYGSTGVPD
ncbi:MAG: hypothetical protein IPJ00_07310 [Saprospirales bacterium]|jgi:hypothetical protein|nr:hypothetical protein [Saprospirales bacterium]